MESGRVRDHLANERTFLAWVRTGIAMMGFGVLIAKLRFQFGAAPLPHSRIISSVTVGAVFIVIGLLTVVVSAWIFTRIGEAIDREEYQPIRSLPLALTAGILLLGFLALLYVLGLLQ